MGEQVSLRAEDGQELNAYVSWPQGEPIAGLVVIQEIFGVNEHIRTVADEYAKDGFLAVAPALFDRYEKGVDLGYDGADMQKALSFISRVDMNKAMQDVDAAVQYAANSTGKRVGVIGYCFGGTIAWLTATRLSVQAAVGYYGGRIGNYAQEEPKSPVMLHFGKEDKHIPPEEVAKITSAHPEVQVFWYDAGHAFNATPRASFHPEASRLARERSLEFLKKHLAE